MKGRQVSCSKRLITGKVRREQYFTCERCLHEYKATEMVWLPFSQQYVCENCHTRKDKKKTYWFYMKSKQGSKLRKFRFPIRKLRNGYKPSNPHAMGKRRVASYLRLRDDLPIEGKRNTPCD